MSENLSLQVHPADTRVPAGSRGKEESWLVLAAGPNARLPARTVHAIGQGVTTLEAQQSSDVTYRLYYYGCPVRLT